MRFMIIAVVVTLLSVYGALTGVPGSLDHQHESAYEFPAMPIEPDDDEDENRVRTRKGTVRGGDTNARATS